MRSRIEYSLALLLDLAGGALALLFAARTWLTITTPRERPLPDDVLNVSGRTLDSSPTALALVALAGVVAVLATKGLWRRAIGALLVLDGALLIWRAARYMGSFTSWPRIDSAQLVHDKHPSVTFGSSGSALFELRTHASWAPLTVVCGVLVILAGLLIAWRSGSWAGMSQRYQRSGADVDIDPEFEAAKANASLWSAIERGDDPTDHGSIS